MIEIIKAKKAFQEYVSNFSLEDEKIKLKIDHIERTSTIARKIAESLKLEKEEIELAELIGLLHDIGRFEQIRKYHTFNDSSSIDHGEFGARILFEKGLIRRFIEDSQYDQIIKTAILNHNQAKIEEGLDTKTLLHSKIIRDADKTDIFYILTIEEKRAIYQKAEFSEEKISDEIYKEFKEEKLIYYPNMTNNADLVVAHFVYLYDLNFPYSLQYIWEKGYIDDFYQRFYFQDLITQKRFEEIYQETKQYVKNRLEGKEK